jgi:hypothetical protein
MVKKKTTAGKSQQKSVRAPTAVASVRNAPVKPKRSTGAIARTKPPSALTSDLRELILSSRQAVARGVNAALVILYWQIGRRIRTDILSEKRAEYGEEILPTLSAKLVPEFGHGFSTRNLARMISLAEVFPDSRILATLSKELSEYRRAGQTFDLTGRVNGRRRGPNCGSRCAAVPR